MNQLRKSIHIAIEKVYVRTLRLKHIPASTTELLYVDLKTYKGPEITMDDITITKGDKVAELHIDNLNIHTIDGTIRSIIKAFRSEMKVLTAAVEEHPDFKDVKAAYATTVLHPLLSLLGFKPLPMKPGPYRAYLGLWENMLKKQFSASGNVSNVKQDPMICWITISNAKEKIEKGNAHKRWEKY